MAPFMVAGDSATLATVIRAWMRFIKNTGGLARTAQGERFSPSPARQRLFLGFLLAEESRGGETARNYLLALPRALARVERRTKPRFGIDAAVKREAQRVAKEVPAVTPLRRDPASNAVVVAVLADAGTRQDVRDAIALQQVTAARGINVYKTKYAGADTSRPLQWRDVTFTAHGADVKFRREKTATKHTGTFPVLHLVPSPDEAVVPCAVAALRRARTRASAAHVRGTDLVFPQVRDTHVTAALRRHAPPGIRLSTHSLRSGGATAVWEAGASDRQVRQAGRWRSQPAADKYAHQSVAMVRALQERMAAVARGAAAGAGAALHSPQQMDAMMKKLSEMVERVTQAVPARGLLGGDAPDADDGDAAAGAAAGDRYGRPVPGDELENGQVRQVQRKGVPLGLLLMTRRGPKVWRGYWYDSDTHRAEARGNLDHTCALPAEDFATPTDRDQLMKYTRRYEGDVRPESDLWTDSAAVRAAAAGSKNRSGARIGTRRVCTSVPHLDAWWKRAIALKRTGIRNFGGVGAEEE